MYNNLLEHISLCISQSLYFFQTNQPIKQTLSSSMASMSMMTSSFLGGSSAAAMITKQLPTTTTNRHGQLSIRANNTIKVAQGEKIALKNNQEEESVNGRRRRRRGLVFGGVAAVAVAFSLSKNAMADDDTEEPKRGTPEAKKKYAPVCVTNPTARICRR